MKPFYSISDLAEGLDEDEASVARGLIASGVKAYLGHESYDLARYATAIENRRASRVIIVERLDPIGCRIIVATDALPELWKEALRARTSATEKSAANAMPEEPEGIATEKTEVTPSKSSDAAAGKSHLNTDAEKDLAGLFDPVKISQLEAMFPDGGKWSSYVARGRRNGLADAAKCGRGSYNPYRAARWWQAKGYQGWDWPRCIRRLANNLPDRSLDSKHLLTGDFG